MRILTWNIARGWRDAAPAATALSELNADVMVLTELRSNQSGLGLVAKLRKLGYAFVLYADGYTDSSGVLIAARTHITPLMEHGPSQFPHRWQHFAIEGTDVEFVGIYLNRSPGPRETLKQKQDFWDRIVDSATRLVHRRAVILGDLNTGLHRIDEEHATFRCAASFETLLNSGWIDGFRLLHKDRRAYSWWSTKRGFRLDHAFLSPAISGSVRSAEYVTKTSSHTLAHNTPRPWPPELGSALSDHAALLLELG
jgi:exodeoxyribonuclease-3